MRQFGIVTANPMWNQNFSAHSYENDAQERFGRSMPPSSSADWGWIQHMFTSLKPNGKMAVVLDTGAVSRGSGNQGSNREWDIRKVFVEGDLVTPGDQVEALVLLSENLFFNTSAPGIILVLNRAKSHPGEILLINASKLCAKGRPKNYLTNEHIELIHRRYRDWQAEESQSAIITTAETARNDYNLSPSRYVATNDVKPPLPLEEPLVLLAQAEEARAEADVELDKVLTLLGFGEWRCGSE